MRPLGEISLLDIHNEIRTVKQLCNGDNVNIVRLFSHGTLQASFYYIDMELCDKNLHTYIIKSSLIPIAELWDIMKDVTNGLTFIHSKGQVHRDLKPRNSK
jgi:serine/threonine protein kinase